jgi:hypothetical protein
MSLRRFLVLLRGLSADALYRYATRDTPREVTGAEATRSAINRM